MFVFREETGFMLWKDFLFEISSCYLDQDGLKLTILLLLPLECWDYRCALSCLACVNSLLWRNNLYSQCILSNATKHCLESWLFRLSIVSFGMKWHYFIEKLENIWFKSNALFWYPIPGTEPGPALGGREVSKASLLGLMA
jgi:hypothetical protein